MNVLCLASYEKGHPLLAECKRQGCGVVLLTSQCLQDKVRWPEGIDEIFYMPDQDHQWDRGQTINAVSFLARTRIFDRIIALDDFDVEMGAALREHLRVPGMGETTARHFRDKLAMRMGATATGIRVPEFIPVLHHGRLHEFMQSVPAPWVLKPRSMAGAIGIKKVYSESELWQHLEALGDMQSRYLLERFVAGDIFHVDSIVLDQQVVFAIASGYGRPPMEVSHEGGIFTTRILERESETAQALLAMNERVLQGLRMRRGVSHTEFIRAHSDGALYFLETSARVGGAHISDLVEAATGMNLWAEWAKVEVARPGTGYAPAMQRNEYAGLLVSLARQAQPDTSAYSDPEIVWRMNREHHVGLIVRSPDPQRVQHLLNSYVVRVRNDFHASAPPQEKATN